MRRLLALVPLVLLAGCGAHQAAGPLHRQVAITPTSTTPTTLPPSLTPQLPTTTVPTTTPPPTTTTTVAVPVAPVPTAVLPGTSGVAIATATITQAGFRYAISPAFTAQCVTYDLAGQPVWNTNRVVGQQPPAGVTAPLGTTVTIDVC